MKSPLSLQNRRFKSPSALRELIPVESIVHFYLTYDGEMEIDLASSGRYVVGHTNCYSIYEFWTCIFHNPEQVAKVVEYFDNIQDKNVYYILQETLPKYADPFVRTAIFFLLCKFSKIGQASRGSFERDSYTPTSVNNMMRLPQHSMKVVYDEGDNFIDGITKNKLKCDYAVVAAGHFEYNLLKNAQLEKIQYDETAVNHEELRDCLSSTAEKMAIVYHFSPVLLKFYKDHKLYFVDKWGRITQRQDKAVEVIVANF